VSRLRARCPDCRTFTAVAIGPGYECHSCGREYGAGMVRVPQAWGEGGESMAEAARLPLPFPEAAVVEEETLDEQTLAVAIDLPERPVVLGGCCCAHIGAVEALAARNGRIALVWLDAHGDLNTPESSPSGNLWGMPLRMILDSGAVDPADTILLGARSLDAPEREFVASISLRTQADELEQALEGTEGAYVALDVDSLEPGEIHPFMPEPGGLTLAEVEKLLLQVRERAPVLGAGFSGLAAEPENVEPLTRLALALGL
jgi:arginase